RAAAVLRADFDDHFGLALPQQPVHREQIARELDDAVAAPDVAAILAPVERRLHRALAPETHLKAGHGLNSTIFGSGMGTMKRPPRFWYSCSRPMISGAKF